MERARKILFGMRAMGGFCGVGDCLAGRAGRWKDEVIWLSSCKVGDCGSCFACWGLVQMPQVRVKRLGLPGSYEDSVEMVAPSANQLFFYSAQCRVSNVVVATRTTEKFVNAFEL